LRRWLVALILLAIVAAVAGWFLSAPRGIDLATGMALGDTQADATRGERIFWAGGCASCHAAAKAEGDARLQLGGGAALVTPFGSFVPPNISPHQTDGIGGWTLEDFANAMLRGVSPQKSAVGGDHYYPAFPYASYVRMNVQDVADLFAFMQTLPAVAGKVPENDIGFPFNIRRGLGLWKLLFLDPAPVIAVEEAAGAQVALGRYLVEGPGHCGECHTPRTLFGAGGSDKGNWLAGAPAAEGGGRVPNITPGGLKWSAAEIATFLKDGTTPDFDFVGGSMASVVKNLAHLSDEDRAAIVAYLKAVPARE
jgi:mono/diheme cytochrome c family protein